MVETITWEIKKEGQKRPKDTQLARTKKGKKLVSLVVGTYFTHGSSNVTYMQIMRFNSNGRFRTSITRQRNLPLHNKG
jgi:hypothetical protein